MMEPRDATREPPAWAVRRARQIVGIADGESTAAVRLIALALDLERRKQARGGDVLVDRAVLQRLVTSAQALLFFLDAHQRARAPEDRDPAIEVEAGEIQAAIERGQRALGVRGA